METKNKKHMSKLENMLFDHAIDSKLKSFTIMLTPEIATELLKRNKNNRTPRVRAIDSYAAAMTEGQWKESHQGIALAKDESLLDGQGRCHGVIKSGIPVPMRVTLNVDKDVFEHIDGGARRFGADVLSIHGVKNARCISSACSIILKSRTGKYHRSNPTAIDILSQYNQDSDYFDSVSPKAVDYQSRGGRLISASWLLGIHGILYFGKMADIETIDDFVMELGVGAGAMIDSPALEFRNFIAKLRAQGTKFTNQEVFFRTVAKIWNVWKEGGVLEHKVSTYLKGKESFLPLKK